LGSGIRNYTLYFLNFLDSFFILVTLV
jgi:hypothetical protein